MKVLLVLFLLARIHLTVVAATLQPLDAQLAPNVFVWTDTCNVYVIKDGDAALLIDLGDGSVLDQLESIGVGRVEWVLFTHHHREQCQVAFTGDNIFGDPDDPTQTGHEAVVAHNSAILEEGYIYAAEFLRESEVFETVVWHVAAKPRIRFLSPGN